MKVVLALMRPKMPGRRPEVEATLEDRVTYAVNCIHAGDSGAAHEAAAKQFLMKARELLDDGDDGHKSLIKQIDEVL